ncbi:MAG: FtsX-like permease family protein [Rhodobacterales bacterium]|nr:FtsX-like permease family protein [Rhodobacterales bacterium]
MGTTLVQVTRLSVRDFLHEWRMSVCFVLALAAVLAPLLILFGLKFGLVDTLRSRLIEDPRNREIKSVVSGRLTRDWFAALEARDDIAFLLPRTRAIAATMTLRPAGSRANVTRVELVPSGPGDPLLPEGATAPDGLGTVVLSAAAARALGVGVGDRLTGNVTRVVEGRRQAAGTDLGVAAIVPDHRFARPAAFAAPALMGAVEDYRDGFAVPGLDWPGADKPDAPRVYAGFRLYAATIDAVAPLRDHLNGLGLEVRTQAAAIETVRALDRSLGAVFWVIAVIGLTGYLLSLGANLWANVDRKTRDLGILRLLGVPTGGLMLFPVVQAGLTAVLGAALAGLATLAVAALINRMFATSLAEGELVCRLLAAHYLLAVAGTLACAVAASALAGYRASRIEPAEGTRDV